MAIGKARLLICEDDIPTLALLQKTFELAGCEVETATTGTVALYKLRANHYDLVVMDYHMPLKDAQDTMNELSKEGGKNTTPKILISAEDRSADAATLGFEAFYPKPITPDLAEAIIKTHVR
ncbi:MAG: response regulator [Chrysiogenetes bacterium]|nr:response regulator [Chrysiogenetes bacterium]